MSFQVSSGLSSPLPLMSACATLIQPSSTSKQIHSDQIAGYIYVFGGYLRNGDDNSNLLQFNTTTKTWTVIKKNTGAWPQGRANSTLISRKSNSLILYGGMDSNELWEYSLSKNVWSQLVNSSENRSNHSAVYLEKIDMMLIYGGTNSKDSGFISLYSFEEKRWKKFKPKERPDFETLDHTANLWKNEFMIVFGGVTEDDVCINDVWKLHCIPHKWSPVGLNLKWEKLECTGDIPSPRSMHSSCIFEDHLYIFGGTSSEGETFNDLYMLDLNTLVWKKLNTLTPLLERNGHAMFSIYPEQDLDEDSDEEQDDEDDSDEVITPNIYIMFGNDKEFKVLDQVDILIEPSFEVLVNNNTNTQVENNVFNFTLQIEYGMLKKKLECNEIKAIEFLLLEIADTLGLRTSECNIEWKNNSGKWIDLKSSSLVTLPQSLVIRVQDNG